MNLSTAKQDLNTIRLKNLAQRITTDLIANLVANKTILEKPTNTCPACRTGVLVCFSCDHELSTKPTPPSLSNKDALDACACPACDGGMMGCNSCGYSFDSLEGFNKGIL